MAFFTHYTDPQKKKLQIFEIIVVIVSLAVLLVMLPRSIRDYRQFKAAVQFHEMGHERLHANDSEGAMRCFETAVRTYPLESSYMEIASIHHFNGKHDREIDVYRDALKVIKNSVALRYALAEAYYLKNDYDPAITELQIVLEIDPSNPQAKGLLDRCRKYKAHPEQRGSHQQAEGLSAESSKLIESLHGHEHHHDTADWHKTQPTAPPTPAQNAENRSDSAPTAPEHH
ncbi:MAG: tetratricopeptide repeat protein [Candidatus Bruticola sp.]